MLQSVNLYNIHFPDLEPLLHVLTSSGANKMTNLAIHEHDEMRDHSCWYPGPEDKGDPRCAEGDGGGHWWKPHLYLSSVQIEHLIESSPALKTLEIDIDRNQTQPDRNELFATLARSKNLEKLIIHVESPSIEGIRNGEQSSMNPPRGAYEKGYSELVVNGSWVKSVFESLRREQVLLLGQEKEPTLKELQVYVGRWETRNDNSMLGPTPAVIGRFVCIEGRGCEGGAGLPYRWGGGDDNEDGWDHGEL